jgi:CheY-like chemotaxis protein
MDPVPDVLEEHLRPAITRTEDRMRTNPRVLLVQKDLVEREILSTWFEMSGFDVTTCPGPAAPTYVCIGDRTGSCPLMAEADAVVLDCRLGSDSVLEGTSSHDLLSLYVSSDKPVVAIGAPEAVDLFDPDEVVCLEQHSRGGVVRAVEDLVGRR